MNKRKYKLLFLNEYLATIIDGEIYLVDTGMPFSFNFLKKDNINIDNVLFHFDGPMQITQDDLMKLTGKDISGIIGLNIISNTGLLINYEEKYIIFGYDEGYGNSLNIQFDYYFGYIVLNDFHLNDIILNNCIFDTCALIPYSTSRYLFDKTNNLYEENSPCFGYSKGQKYKAIFTFQNKKFYYDSILVSDNKKMCDYFLMYGINALVGYTIFGNIKKLTINVNKKEIVIIL